MRRGGQGKNDASQCSTEKRAREELLVWGIGYSRQGSKQETAGNLKQLSKSPSNDLISATGQELSPLPKHFNFPKGPFQLQLGLCMLSYVNLNFTQLIYLTQ